MNHKLKLRATFSISLIVLLSVAFAVYISFKNFQNDTTWVNHSERVRLEIENFSRIPKDISYAIRRATLTNDTLDSQQIMQLKNSIPLVYYKLDSLISDETQTAQLEELYQLIKEYDHESSVVVAMINNTDRLSRWDIDLIQKLEKLVIDIENKASYMEIIENGVINQRLKEQKASQFMTPIALLSLTIITLGIIAFLFNNALLLYEKNKKANEELLLKNDRLSAEMARRVALESLLQNIINSSANGIIALEPVYGMENELVDFKITTSNRRFYEIVGSDHKLLDGQLFAQTLKVIRSEELAKSFKDVALKDKLYQEIHHFDLHGSDRWFFVQAVKNSDGVVATFNDITLQKKHELELLEKQKELEDTNFELEQFAYIASHDLQEPLRKIRAFGDRLVTLLDNHADAKVADYIARMQNAAQRMQKLIDDLLRFSRISRSEMIFAKVDLNNVFEQAKEILEIEIESKHAIIRHEVLPVIMGDQVQLVQLFQNILSNALKYSKPNLAPEIDVNVSKIRKENKNKKERIDYWEITIRDNGIGFDPTYKEKIFVIFQRLHGRTEYQGTGIGLAICEKIAANHQGLIEADSTLGVGSVFKIFFKKGII